MLAGVGSVARVRAVLVGALITIAALAGAGGALADSTTVGETTLTPNSGFPDTTGQSIPVFQGDASGNYVLSSPKTGTVTSWSFLSAGVTTGKQFVLRVLAPVGADGTSWRAVATSDPVAVTSATGVDGVNGPFTTNLAIAVGDRIALQPVDDSAEPIEMGVSGEDGIRYFTTPFADGSSATLAPGSNVDNGQVVPVQATVEYTPALANIEPPVVVHDSTPVTSVQAGELLSCRPGTYNDEPTTHRYYWFWSETTYVRTSPRKLPVAEVSETGLRVSGQTVTLPDLPAFVPRAAPHNDVSTISCDDSASFQGSAPLDVRSAQVRVQPVIPTLATRTVPRARKKPLTVTIQPPSITSGVGVGGTNRCTPGAWAHFPTGFTYMVARGDREREGEVPQAPGAGTTDVQTARRR